MGSWDVEGPVGSITPAAYIVLSVSFVTLFDARGTWLNGERVGMFGATVRADAALLTGAYIAQLGEQLT